MKSLFIIMLLFVCGCTVAEVKVEVLSERTAMENQILGTYNSLDDEMLLAASVRGVDPKGNIKKPRKQSQEHKDVIAAMQILDFHSDDIQSFKQLGWIGEANTGLVLPFEMKKEKIPETLESFADRFTKDEFMSIISQVNTSREIVMHRVIDMNENLSEKDMPEIRKIFGKLNTENASNGEKIQLADDKWTVKK